MKIQKSDAPTAWPADNVERRAIASLVPYARNARTHSEEQVAQIAASMREWGWTNPVLVDEEGTIIAGHGRIQAAQKLGITEASDGRTFEEVADHRYDWKKDSMGSFEEAISEKRKELTDARA